MCLDDLDAVCLGKLREHVAHVGIRFESVGLGGLFRAQTMPSPVLTSGRYRFKKANNADALAASVGCLTASHADVDLMRQFGSGNHDQAAIRILRPNGGRGSKADT